MQKLSCGVACFALIALGFVPAHAQDTVKIGLIMPYSGQFADTAVQLDNAIKLYMQQHGDTVAGKKIEVIRKDTGGMVPDVAKRLSQELIVRDGADILAGFVLTPNALAAGAVSAEAKKLMVVMNAAASIVITKSPYITRTSATVAMLHGTLGNWAAKNGSKRVYTMVSDFGPGIEAENAFHASFKEAGGEIIGAVRFPVANPDFSAFVQRAKEMNPDGIYIWIPGGAQPAAVGKALAERGIDTAKVKVMGQDVLTFESALKSMGDLALGIITVSYYDYNHDSPRNQQFVKAYNDAFHRNPDIVSIGGYDGMHLIYEALKKTGGKADGDSLIAAARGMRWESPRGFMSIDPQTREVVETVYLRRVEKTGDGLRNVEFDHVADVKDPVKAAGK
jgi:branched-chain amino acid transport system substrate-binding protein